MRHKQTPSDPDEPLLSCVKDSLAQVEHQIWLLRNVFWWYLLPSAIPLLAFFAHVSWLKSQRLVGRSWRRERFHFRFSFGAIILSFIT